MTASWNPCRKSHNRPGLRILWLYRLSTQQRAQHSNQFWATALNNRYCHGGGETLLPDFMKIVLSNGFEAELLNEFSPAGSQVTLIPPLTAAEANPLSVDPIDVYEPEANPEAVTPLRYPQSAAPRTTSHAPCSSSMTTWTATAGNG